MPVSYLYQTGDRNRTHSIPAHNPIWMACETMFHEIDQQETEFIMQDMVVAAFGNRKTNYIPLNPKVFMATGNEINFIGEKELIIFLMT